MKSLFEAIDRSDFDEVQKIIAAQPELVDVTLSDYLCRTPLLVALSFMQYDIAFFLIEKGANINAPDVNGSRALDLVRDPETVERLILLGAGVNLKDNMGFCPIHRRNPSETDRILVAHGADPNSRSNILRTPLHIACLRGDSLERIEGLVVLGANIRLRDQKGMHVFDFLNAYAESSEGQDEKAVERNHAIEAFFDSLVD